VEEARANGRDMQNNSGEKSQKMWWTSKKDLGKNGISRHRERGKLGKEIFTNEERKGRGKRGYERLVVGNPTGEPGFNTETLKKRELTLATRGGVTGKSKKQRGEGKDS